MKAYIFFTTTDDRWEICGGSYLVTAESEEEARDLFQIGYEKRITAVEEVDLTVKGQIDIQESVVE